MNGMWVEQFREITRVFLAFLRFGSSPTNRDWTGSVIEADEGLAVLRKISALIGKYWTRGYSTFTVDLKNEPVTQHGIQYIYCLTV
jgi:hypothetical protein